MQFINYIYAIHSALILSVVQPNKHLGGNLLSAFKNDKILGVTNNQGYIHIMSKVMEKAYKILCDKYALVKFCDRIIKQTITMYKNRNEALFLVYRNKSESKTRY